MYIYDISFFHGNTILDKRDEIADTLTNRTTAHV